MNSVPAGIGSSIIMYFHSDAGHREAHGDDIARSRRTGERNRIVDDLLAILRREPGGSSRATD